MSLLTRERKLPSDESDDNRLHSEVIHNEKTPIRVSESGSVDITRPL